MDMTHTDAAATPRYVVRGYATNHRFMGAQYWFKVVDTTTGKSVQTRIDSSAEAQRIARELNEGGK
jgi:hypothetical protein